MFKEIQDDKKTFHSCVSVNKTWCETIIPILWKNPWKFLKREKEELLLNVIISHLSEESRKNLSQSINFLKNSYQKPLFDYISFCRHLNINQIVRIIDTLISFEGYKILIKNEIFNLFINENTKFTHLYIPHQFDYQIHLIPGFEDCLSKIEFLSCDTRIDDNILVGLTEICKSIKELELIIVEEDNNNYGIVNLIKTQKKLFNISLLLEYIYDDFNESFCKILENSLAKHANTIKHFKLIKQPTAKFLSSFVNLKTLELYDYTYNAWNSLKNLSLPYLEILRVNKIPVRFLVSLIENTSGYLIEININNKYHMESDNRKIIQAICQNCPKLKYLRLLVRSSNILEFENLLINCQYLRELIIIIYKLGWFNWDHLFEILTKSSPVNLFKFKFDNSSIYYPIKLESLNLFFENWKDRHPMLLQFNVKGFEDLLEKYESAGVIKKFKRFNRSEGEDFEWILK
ncbi:hypothetical protein C1645_818433 [Glomus cerebriforme]|uniref:F-box domain-containing protein n=1 Tax=Glomus cerebriforme TaxID=658196 RepID=A0A397T9X6_9GLOM|nr:hypothetical protein C1645_818433 [Glomus cerebriforme]